MPNLEDYEAVPAMSEDGITEGQYVIMRDGRVGQVCRARQAVIGTKFDGYEERWCIRFETGGTQGFESAEALKASTRKLKVVRW